MKNTLLLTASVLSLLLTSCKGKEKEKKEGGFFEAVEAVSNIKKLADEGENLEKRVNTLQKATPISKDKIKAFLPETIGDFKRTGFSIGNQMMAEIAVGDASYKKDDKKVELSLMDGAGEQGSAMIILASTKLTLDFEEQNENGFEKTDKINGNKVVVASTKYNDFEESNIETLIYDRFFITLKGKNISLNELKDVFETIDFTHLK